jgi:hypothetical protein
VRRVQLYDGLSLDSAENSSNSFLRKRNKTLNMRVYGIAVSDDPAEQAGAHACLAFSLRITAKTTTKTV